MFHCDTQQMFWFLGARDCAAGLHALGIIELKLRIYLDFFAFFVGILITGSKATCKLRFEIKPLLSLQYEFRFCSFTGGS